MIGFAFDKQRQQLRLSSCEMCAEFFIESPFICVRTNDPHIERMNDRLAWLIAYVGCMDNDGNCNRNDARAHCTYAQSIETPWGSVCNTAYTSIQFKPNDTYFANASICVCERVRVRVHSPSKCITCSSAFIILPPLIRSLKMLWHAMT